MSKNEKKDSRKDREIVAGQLRDAFKDAHDKDKDFTENAWAKKADVSASTVSHLNKGASNLKKATLFSLTMALPDEVRERVDIKRIHGNSDEIKRITNSDRWAALVSDTEYAVELLKKQEKMMNELDALELAVGSDGFKSLGKVKKLEDIEARLDKLENEINELKEEMNSIQNAKKEEKDKDKEEDSKEN